MYWIWFVCRGASPGGPHFTDTPINTSAGRPAGDRCHNDVSGLSQTLQPPVRRHHKYPAFAVVIFLAADGECFIDGAAPAPR